MGGKGPFFRLSLIYIGAFLSWAGALEAILLGAHVLSTHMEVFFTIPTPLEVVVSTITMDSAPPVFIALALIYGGLGTFKLGAKRADGEGQAKGYRSVTIRASTLIFIGSGVLLAFLLYLYFANFTEMRDALLTSIPPIFGLVFAFFIRSIEEERKRRNGKEGQRKELKPKKESPLPPPYV
ncbi:hypothetical protein KEJ19_07355 [Candidatus Bathyarchaeota archaeon]|nr:hypothetical protein [Candidatus Bathyarchaeota archaeon]